MAKRMDYLKSMPIAVLGGGAVALTCAADCKLAGREVRLFTRNEKMKNNIEKAGVKLEGVQRSLYGFTREGKVFLDVVSTDMSEVVKGAGLIVVAISAHASEAYFKTLVPLLEDGQVVHIYTDNYGTLILRKFMKEANCDKKVIVGGWSSAPYGTRTENIGGFVMPIVSAKYRAITLRGASLPMSDIDEFMESVNYLPCMDAVINGDGPQIGDTVLDIGFSNINPVIHVPASILGVSSMENFNLLSGKDRSEYSMYSHGLSPSICEVQYKFYEEECKIADAIGIDLPRYKYKSFFSRRSVLTQEYMGLDENGDDNVVFPLDKPCNEGNVGPDSIEHRYFTEDIPVGCKIYHELGKKFNVATPIIDSMIVIGSAMHKTDFFKESKFDLEYLGIADMDKEELLNFLKY